MARLLVASLIGSWNVAFISTLMEREGGLRGL
jgi:hypothetical protein